MNDGKIIIDKIIEKAEAEAQAMRAQGKKQADAILLQAEEKAKKERQLAQTLAHAEGEKVSAKEISGAQLQGKIAILEVKQCLLEEVVVEAKRRLETLPDEQYQEVIGTMLLGLDPSFGNEILVNKGDRERLAAVIATKGYTLSSESREILGGFIVKNGDVEYNYSFESIISVEQEDMRQLAAQILF